MAFSWPIIDIDQQGCVHGGQGMAATPRRSRKFLFITLSLGLLAVTAGVLQRHALQSWFYARQLQKADETARPRHLARLVAMGEPAVPRLIGCLQKDDAGVCESARSGLEQLLAAWSPRDPRSQQLAARFFEMQPTFSPAGQTAALQMLSDLLGTGAESVAKSRAVVGMAMKDRSAEQRYLAITVALRPELNMLAGVVPLLDDPDARIRRMAMRALGPVPESNGGMESPALDTDDLLRWLHDPDAEVRALCEEYLTRNRGCSPRDVYFGRLLTHPDAMKRLALLVPLTGEDDLDLGNWLKRLSKDADPSVRAAAARTAAENRVDFADRLDQMMRTDPDGTVRQLAEHYRKHYR